MSVDYKPYIAAEKNLPELTLKGIILGLVLALILAISNTFLALKIGVLTASSIPAAILSMGILRLFRNSTILENNLVQTCASAGEAIAGGIVYTAPALVIVRYWMNFDYLQTFIIAIIGGTLGVLFTIPLRRVFMNEKQLRFPEGTAIAEVLKAHVQNANSVLRLLIGGSIGAIIELCQTGFKVLANSAQFFITKGSTTAGFGMGFSATLIGAGYLMGFEAGLSLLIGAVISNVFCLGLLSHIYASSLHLTNSNDIAAAILGGKVRYVGIGAMLVAGIITLFTLIRPFYESLTSSVNGLVNLKSSHHIPRTERDMPLSIVIIGIIAMLVASYIFFNFIFDFQMLNASSLAMKSIYLVIGLLYILLLGFVFSTICGYFSGLVGVTASPGSSVAIAAVLIAAVALKFFLNIDNAAQTLLIHQAEAITIVLASIVMGAACVANNNSQDLKVGHILGATPWKQQLMLLLGGLVAALIIPLVMQLLFSVYGIAGVVPHSGMDTTQTLPAPPAAAMAAISQGVFSGNLPWNMMFLGGAIAVAAVAISPLLKRLNFKLSFISLAIGMYLPLASSTPLFLGSLMSLLVSRQLVKKNQDIGVRKQRSTILACGLVAGAAIMSVILAIPFSLLHNPDSLNLLPTNLYGLSQIASAIVTVLLCSYLYRQATK